MPGAPITLTAFEDRLFADLPEGEVASALKSRGLPSRRAEAWKWSDLRAILRDEKQASGDYAGDIPPSPLTLPNAFELTIRNGTAFEETPPDGIGLTRGLPEPVVLPDADLASLATAAHTLTVELMGSPPPLIVRRLSDGEGRHADRLRVRVAPGTAATLVETHEATGSPFANSLTEIALGEGATLTRFVVQPASDEAVIVHTTLASVAEEATFGQMALTMGGALARHETRLTQASDSRVALDALYGLSGKRHCDTTAHVDFTGQRAETTQLVKGVATDRARGVFQGKFHVAPGAQETDARMSHHALLLSQGAQVNAKPELEIYADDVECAHGNTVGALDGEALFYLRQRGLSEAAARGLLVDAFAGEVLARVKDDGVRGQLEALFRQQD